MLDLREWDFQQGYVSLDGEWELYMSELLTPEDLVKRHDLVRDFVNFPGTWNETSNRSDGYATYHLKIILKSPQPLAIELPHFYSNYSLWINNTLVASNGTVGRSKSTSHPQWLPQTVLYDVANDTLNVVVQISNFHHAKGGIRESIRVGLRSDLQFKRKISVAANTILCGALMVIGFIFVATFFFKGEVSAILFAAMCFTWAVRQGFSNLYIFTAAYPDFPWEIAVKIEYITLYLMMVWATVFVSSVFQEDSSNIFKYLFVGCNLIFVIFTVFVQASTYTQFLPAYLSFAVVLLLYIVYVLIRAVVYERQAVWLMVGCLMLGVVVFSYDIISYEGLTSYNSMIIFSGYFVMFILIGVGLSIRYGFIKRAAGRRDVLTYDDLYGSRK